MQKTLSALSALDDEGPRSSQSSFTDVKPLEAIGDGAHAQVYKGRCRTTGCVCAMKCAPPQSMDAILLEQEAAILRCLDHPHITRLLGSGTGPHGNYLAMELCLGGDMFDCLGREGHLTERVAARVTGQVLGAVAHMHTRGICHRDVKKENLLVVASGPVEAIVVKVCDFGISQREDSPKPMANFCTPPYAAPEVLSGEAGDKAADLWSCGVVFYDFLCGSLPFDGDSREDVLAMVSAGGASFEEDLWTDVSDGARGLVRRLLRTDRHKRFNAEQSLAHPWVARLAPKGKNAKLPPYLLKLKNTAEQAARLKEELGALEDGVLPWELSAALRHAGISEDPAASSKLEAEASRGSGLVDCSKLVMNKRLGSTASARMSTASIRSTRGSTSSTTSVRRRCVQIDALPLKSLEQEELQFQVPDGVRPGFAPPPRPAGLASS